MRDNFPTSGITIIKCHSPFPNRMANPNKHRTLSKGLGQSISFQSTKMSDCRAYSPCEYNKLGNYHRQFIRPFSLVTNGNMGPVGVYIFCKQPKKYRRTSRFKFSLNKILNHRNFHKLPVVIIVSSIRSDSFPCA